MQRPADQIPAMHTTLTRASLQMTASFAATEHEPLARLPEPIQMLPSWATLSLTYHCCCPTSESSLHQSLYLSMGLWGGCQSSSQLTGPQIAQAGRQLRLAGNGGNGGGGREVWGWLERTLKAGPCDEGVLQSLPGGPPCPGVRVLHAQADVRTWGCWCGPPCKH